MFYFCGATMFKSGSYKSIIQLFVLVTVFLSILISLGLPSLPEPDFVDDDEVGVNLMQKDMKEYCENSDAEIEHPEEIDLFSEELLPVELLYNHRAGKDFPNPGNHLPDHGTDIFIPPPKSFLA